MRKSIISWCLLFLLLSIITSAVILIFGKTNTLEFEFLENANPQISFENESGEIEVLEERTENNKYIIKIKSKKPGKVFFTFTNGNYEKNDMLYIHKSMIITRNTYFGNSNGAIIIPISLSIILIYTLYLLIKRYNYCIKDNLYQYTNIAYLGIILFMLFCTIDNFFSIINYNGLFDTINRIISSISEISMVLFPIALITFILVTISNINLIIKEGRSLRNLFGVFLGIFLCILTVLPDLLYSYLLKTQVIDIFNQNSIGPYLFSFFESFIYLTITYLECVLVGTIIIAIKSVKKKVEFNKDYMIILGCQIKKDGSLTPLLKGRVDRAIDFRNEQFEATRKDLIFIPSGGKGEDEIISEAEAIKKYLVEQGIKEENILKEDKSTNTFENINFSNKLIKDKDAKIAFSTTNYHILRAGLIATEQGLKLEGIGSKTKAYFWINAFIREFIGTLYAERKKHIIAFILILIFLSIMISITYFTNNI